jgi:hypothetical protein
MQEISQKECHQIHHTSKLLTTFKIPTQISNLHYRHCIHGYSQISYIAIEEKGSPYSADAGGKRA